MSHHHSHDTSGSLKIAFFLNLGFTLLEIVGGIWTNSMAIVADALHDLGDSFSLGLAWFLDRYSHKGRDKNYSYGYRRYSLLGALINTIVLIVGSLIIFYEAIPRILQPEPTNAVGMVGFAIVGIIVNGVAVWRVRGDESMNAQVVGWHLLEDVLGWVAVLIVSIVLLFTDFYILDPLLSILITLFVLYNVIKRLYQTMSIFLQAVPDGVDIEKIQDELEAIERVKSVHHTHAWSLDGEHHVLSTHLVVADDATKEEILRVKREAIELTTGTEDFEHITIEVEYEDEDCRMKDSKLQP